MGGRRSGRGLGLPRNSSPSGSAIPTAQPVPPFDKLRMAGLRWIALTVLELLPSSFPLCVPNIPFAGDALCSMPI